jgi:hypothetical protein
MNFGEDVSHGRGGWEGFGHGGIMRTIKSPNDMKTFSILRLRPLVEGGDWSGECGRCFPRLFVPEALKHGASVAPSTFPCGSRTAKAGPY